MSPRPEFVGLDPERWKAVRELASELVERGEVAAVVIAARRTQADVSLPSPAVVAGRLRPGGRELCGDDRFLVASLTKPVVAALALRLVELGRLSLTDRVVDHLPEFSGGARRPVMVRHLLTHTSGLPEVWSDNRELRQRHAGRDEFVRASLRTELTGRPGRQSVYSSVGFSLLGAVLESAGDAPLPELLQRFVFGPLAMTRSELGTADPDVAKIAYPPDHEATDWDWNSDYWRAAGAPWGGLISTAGDLMKFLGAFATGRAVSPSSRDASWTDHRSIFPQAGERAWGLGWRFNWPGHAAAFCDLLPEAAVGHYGATGTLMWHSQGRIAVILTTTPALGRPRALQLLSNAVAAAFLDAEPGP